MPNSSVPVLTFSVKCLFSFAGGGRANMTSDSDSTSSIYSETCSHTIYLRLLLGFGHLQSPAEHLHRYST